MQQLSHSHTTHTTSSTTRTSSSTAHHFCLSSVVIHKVPWLIKHLTQRAAQLTPPHHMHMIVTVTTNATTIRSAPLLLKWLLTCNSTRKAAMLRRRSKSAARPIRKNMLLAGSAVRCEGTHPYLQLVVFDRYRFLG